ncbi:MAG: hypothetical protein ACM4AI_01930 [Acidobacteriota bacterium]
MMRIRFSCLAVAAAVLMTAAVGAQTKPAPPKPEQTKPAPAKPAPAKPAAAATGDRVPKQQPATGAAQAPAQKGPVTLGTASIPKAVMANGQPLAAGTYTVRLAAEGADKPAVGQTPDLSRWCEFVQGGQVKGKELCTVLSASEVGAVVKDTPPASGSVKVQMLKGNDYLRVWANRGGTHYLVHLAVSSGL